MTLYMDYKLETDRTDISISILKYSLTIYFSYIICNYSNIIN